MAASHARELHDAVKAFLEHHPGAAAVHAEDPPAATDAAISSWEKQHGLSLPEDMLHFYSTSDGWLLRWDAVAHGREATPLGCLSVNSLEQLQPVDPLTLRDERNQLRMELRPELIHGDSSAIRAFNLDARCESGRVLLLLLPGKYASDKPFAQVWIQDGSCALSMLAASFSAYLRLLVLHLGLPRWQYAYTEAGLDPTCRQWLRLMAPERLADEQEADDGGSVGRLGVGWGACDGPGSGAIRKAKPVRTLWVEGPAPTHAAALRLLSLSSLGAQQPVAAAKPSSAAGRGATAVALLSGGSRSSSTTSTNSCCAPAPSPRASLASSTAAARPPQETAVDRAKSAAERRRAAAPREASTGASTGE